MAQYDSAFKSNSKRNIRKFSDIDFNFERNLVTSDVIAVEDVIAIKRAVKNLVQTNFYERPFQPVLGCGVRELLFENFTPMTKVFLQNKISEVLKNYEPRTALDGGNDGLDLIKKIIYKSKKILKINGTLALEIGNKQIKKVSKILIDNNFRIKCVIKDYKNNIRCVLADYRY